MLRRLGLITCLLFSFVLWSCEGDLSDAVGDIDIDLDTEIDWPEIDINPDKDVEEIPDVDVDDSTDVDVDPDVDPDLQDTDEIVDVDDDGDDDLDTDEVADEDVIETQGCGQLQVPETFTFQSATVGQIASGLIEITNQPSEGSNGPTVQATQFEFLENPQSVFSIMNVPPVNLPSQTSTSLNVICLMTMPGQYTGRLKVTFGPMACENSRTAEIELVCNSEMAILHTHPKVIEFGYVPQGTSETIEIAIANQGTLNLSIYSEPSVESAVEGVFTLVSDTEHPSVNGSTIEMGNAVVVSIRFQPPEATYYHGALVVETNDSQLALGSTDGHGFYRIPLIGRGIFNCPEGYTHQGKTCLQTNTSGVVTGCIPGTRKCSDEGEAYQVCKDDGTGWEADTFCDEGMECLNGACLWQLCEPGVRRCAGVVEYTCLENGMEYNGGTVCRDTNFCTEDTCEWGKVPSCQYTQVGESLCDDVNPCTVHVCDPIDGCLLDDAATEALNDTPCGDQENQCIGTSLCKSGVCQAGDPVDCDDNNPCTIDDCDPQGGCTHELQNVSCNDLNACTNFDRCKQALSFFCEGQTVPCDPEEAQPCSDGTRCIQALGPVCVGQEVVCDDGIFCTADSCDSDFGCKFEARVDETCDDGNNCTTNDHCTEAKTCVGEAVVFADDGKWCNGTEICDPETGEEGHINVPDCDDGIRCTSDVCDPTLDECVSTPTENYCDDLGECMNSTCDAELGCTYEPADDYTTCDRFPDIDELCFGGVCVRVGCTNNAQCDDGLSCTVDACLPRDDGQPGYICSNIPNDALCDDGQWCNGTETCVPGAGCTEASVQPVCNDDIYCTEDRCNEELDACEFTPLHDRCEDDSECTLDACVEGTGCTHEQKAEGSPCEDGNLCTLNEACWGGICRIQDGVDPVYETCDDGEICTEDFCNPLLGCQFSNNTDPCDDENDCTVQDRCSGGSCRGNTIDPSDGLVCNGSEYCDEYGNLTREPVVCDDSIACTVNSCDDSLGGCVFTPDHSLCDDGNDCTADTCDPIQGCKWTAVGDYAPCSTTDGIGEVCIAGVCTARCDIGDACNDGKSCTVDSCDPATGTCSHLRNDQFCLDLDTSYCDGDDVCLPTAAGADSTTGCIASGTRDCDDGIECTVDSCNETSGCVNSVSSALCNDDNSCTGDVCNRDVGCIHNQLDQVACINDEPCSEPNGVCQAGICISEVTDCNDDNPCTANTCDEEDGCLTEELPNGTYCGSDNDQPMTCLNGVCVVRCTNDDQCLQSDNPCVVGECDQQTSRCILVANDSLCDDGQYCNGVETCDLEEGCVNGTPIDCPDSSECALGICDEEVDACKIDLRHDWCDDFKVCTTDICDIDEGCQYSPNDNPCDDEDICTINDQCSEGECSGEPNPCDDGNACTTGTCQAGVGCVYQPVDCNDDNICTYDFCNPYDTDGDGCYYEENNLPCDDENICTSGDFCSGGECVGTGTTDCSDGNECTEDFCVAGTGCSRTNVQDGTPCGDPDSYDRCHNGLCVSPCESDGECDDGLECTVDVCDLELFICTYIPNSEAGGPCDDGQFCNGIEICQPGVGCVAGEVPTCEDEFECTEDMCSPTENECVHLPMNHLCDDGNICTENQCNPDNGGCEALPIEGRRCSDGEICTVDDVCNDQGVCEGVQRVCDDSNSCTNDYCSPGFGCRNNYLANGTDCGDFGDGQCYGGICLYPCGPDGECTREFECTQVSCNTDTNLCEVTLDHEFCDDGFYCNGEEICSSTLGCVSGMEVVCDDGADCSYDYCDEETDQCRNDIIPLACDDHNPCTVDECLPYVGCQNDEILVGEACEDGNVCTTGEICDEQGVCRAEGDGICDDDNPCTVDTCDPLYADCYYAVVGDGTECDDEDLCTVSDMCSQGLCLGVPRNCDDQNECSADSCDSETGCVNEIIFNKPCDDQDGCTSGTLCFLSGENVPTCGRGNETDCDDGNPCTVDTCDSALGCSNDPVEGFVACGASNEKICVDGQCVPDINCTSNEDCDDGMACTSDFCDMTGGNNTCYYLTNDALCDGYDVCTSPKACIPGVGCIDRDPPNCNDYLDCTLDACDSESGGCTHEPRSNFCNDDNSCTVDYCDTVLGCSTVPLSDVACDDGNACTSGDQCRNGICVPTDFVVCGDQNACTADSCDPVEGCIQEKLTGGFCNDSNACTQNDTCDDGACSGEAIDIDDGNPCTVDSCDPYFGVVHTPVSGNSCDDGNACTPEDRCDAGVCRGLGELDCSDDNPCTRDLCSPDTGCYTVHRNNVPCDDENVCTINEQCVDGECLADEENPENRLNCDDFNPCSIDVCDPINGCDSSDFYSDFTSCDLLEDETEVCMNGSCVAFCLEDAHCDDGYSCTTDSCNTDTNTCVNERNDDVCPDDLFCNGSEICDPTHEETDPVTGCAPVEALDCDDNIICTVDECDEGLDECLHTGINSLCPASFQCIQAICDPSVGCRNEFLSGLSCNDNNPCTTGDVCEQGLCVGEPNLNCNDRNACTRDRCFADAGCSYEPMESGVSCDDDNFCTEYDVCDGAGTCGGVATDCSDTNPCTDDLACDPDIGCLFTPLSGVDCGAPTSCYEGGLCINGECLGTGEMDCDDDDACTFDYCEPGLDCVHERQAGACDDGNACTIADVCTESGCLGTTITCDDDNDCTSDSCDPEQGCVYSNLQDGHYCGEGAAGICESGLCRMSCQNPAECADDNPCTTEGCVDGRCKYEINPVAVLECPGYNNEYCDGEVYCDLIKGCVTTVVDCDDGIDCTVDTCNEIQRCYSVPNSSLCDDGNPCTSDGCSVEEGGCFHTPLTGITCDTGNACMINGICQEGLCVGEQLNCQETPADNPCTRNYCDPLEGCQEEILVGRSCSDNNICTSLDYCNQNAECVGANTQNCDDSNPCTQDSCDPQLGCVWEILQGAPCEDGNPCTLDGYCDDFANCVSRTDIECDDNNNCTGPDSCEGGLCVYPPINGGNCTDLNGVQGVCQSGFCQVGCQSAADCDDGIDCTVDSCDEANKCHHEFDDSACDDGNSCNGAESCSTAGCQSGIAIVCDDETECTTDSCDPETGDCTFAPNHILCDDGNSCTANICKSGQGCIVEVKVDQPCDDGDECTTTDRCVLDRCEGVVSVDCDDDKECTADYCSEGECQHVPVQGDCLNENNLCYEYEGTCVDGECVAEAFDCDDGNPCTVDSCDPEIGCVSDFEPNGTSCDDGLDCTVGDFCSSGVCVGGPEMECPYQECRVGQCNEETGECDYSEWLPDEAWCDDGNPCTLGDRCWEGACQAGSTSLDCDDQDPCTTDTCDGTGCHNIPDPRTNGTACDIGYLDKGTCQAGQCVVLCDVDADCTDLIDCTVNERCVDCEAGEEWCGGSGSKYCEFDTDDSQCQSGGDCGGGEYCNVFTGCWPLQAIDCDDGVDCTTDSCTGNEDEPCQYVPNNSLCDDDDPCTVDLCQNADIANGIAGGCVHEPAENGIECESTNACVVNSTCYNGVCSGELLDCADDNPCTQDVCDSALGCTYYSLDGYACDDGDPCTIDTECFNRQCVGGTANTCDDDNPCTDEVCEAGVGCVFTNNTDPCDDDDICSLGDTCTNGVCLPTDFNNCDTDDACLEGICIPGRGCAYEAVLGLCDDGNKCTTGDSCECVGATCESAQCVGSGVIDPDDNQQCTVDYCDPETGVYHEKLPDNTTCDDGNMCTLEDICFDGTCRSGMARDCDDLNPCTVDSCDTTVGCVNDPIADFTDCGGGRVCFNGLCENFCQNDTECEDGFSCTVDRCDNLTHICTRTLDHEYCDNQQVCDGVETCSGTQGCIDGDPLYCNDGIACTTDLCDNSTGCYFVPNDLLCEDNEVCTTDICSTELGCIYEGVAAGQVVPCDDGNLCTGPQDYCQGSVCVGETKDCDDNNFCTTDSCDPLTGLCERTVDTGIPCDDGDYCTVNDRCAMEDNQVVCLGEEMDCHESPDNPCTQDTCINGSCFYTELSGIPCDDFNPCTLDDRCTGSICMGSEMECPDNDILCKYTICDPASGECTLTIDEADNSPCRHPNLCIQDEVCVSGECVGDEIVCEDNPDQCMKLACEPDVGVCMPAPDVGAECDDDNTCTSNDVCDEEGICVGDLLDCNDHNPCTADLCIHEEGCTYEEDNSGEYCSNNGQECSILYMCSSGHCQNGFCCAQGDCCLVADDCPDSYNSDPVCNDEESCSGRRGVKTCNSFNQCFTEWIEDDSACYCDTFDNDGVACTENTQCDSGHCQNGFCCSGGDCCSAASDCPESYDTGAVCDSPSFCQGHLGEKACNDRNQCFTRLSDDDSACDATVEQDCGYFAGHACNGDVEQDPFICEDRCTNAEDCSASAQCVEVTVAESELTENVCMANCLSYTCGFGMCDWLWMEDNEVCMCLVDSDCGDDGNLCNGSPECIDNICVHSEENIVVCDDPAEVDNPCADYECNEQTGSCEWVYYDGSYCDDGQTCTSGDVCLEGRCVPQDSYNCECENNMDCAFLAEVDRCKRFECVQIPSGETETIGACQEVDSVLTCPDPPSACASYECDSTTGGCKLTLLPVGEACDDGLDGTEGDACDSQGECHGSITPLLTPCYFNSDCAHLEDGNLCNGTPMCVGNYGEQKYCVESGIQVTCGRLDETILGDCSTYECNPATGKCEMFAVEDGTSCEDSISCTVGDTCFQGVCIGTATPDCACNVDEDCNAVTDTNLCNGTLHCVDGACQHDPATLFNPGTACDFDLNDSCYSYTCNRATGECEKYDEQPEGTSCSLQDICADRESEVGVCENGQCTREMTGCPCLPEDGYTDPPPDYDGEFEAADPSTWTYCHFYEDQNPCNGAYQCVDEYCVKVDDPVVCNQPESPCLYAECNSSTGTCDTFALDDGTRCDDGNTCTLYDQCQSGQCIGTWTNRCDCTGNDDCATADDGNYCNGFERLCDPETKRCVSDPTTAVTCPTPDDPCRPLVCDPDTGLCNPEFLENGASCADSNACTINERCWDGVCVYELNQCSCNGDADCAQYAIQHNCYTETVSCVGSFCTQQYALGNSCDDENTCTSDDACAICDIPAEEWEEGLCVEGTVICEGEPVDAGTPCEDEYYCTINDQCDGEGYCVGGEPNPACEEP